MQNFCAQCGSPLTQGSSFCGSCGSHLGGGEGVAGSCPGCSRSDIGDGRFCKWCNQFLVGAQGIKLAGLGRRVGAYILDIALFILTLIIGYIIWWLFTLSRGQTPGKQVLGIRVMRNDGTPSRWGWTFIREFIMKGVVVGTLGEFLAGIPWIVDFLWAFWDKDNQTLHDKVMKTVVVDDRALRSRAYDASPSPL